MSGVHLILGRILLKKGVQKGTASSDRSTVAMKSIPFL